jgi:hypothetical protein
MTDQNLRFLRHHVSYQPLLLKRVCESWELPMEYNVIMPDGSKFAAQNIDQLNGWITEGRILPTTVIERISDGARGPASMLPGLVFPQASTPAQAPLFAPSTDSPTPPPAATVSPDVPKGVQFKEPDYQRAPQHQAESIDDMGKPLSYVSFTREHTDRSVVPEELRGKFNWGAFFLTWIWGLCHRAWISLLALVLGLAVIPFSSGSQDGSGSTGVYAAVGILQLGFAIFLGIMGNTFAWKSGRFKTPEDCRSCQSAWGQWGCGLFVFFLLGLAVLACFVIPSIRNVISR